MVAKFRVVDTSSTPYPARDGRPAETVHNLHLLDLDTKAPMRQMPKMKLKTPDDIGRYSAGQLNGKDVTIAVREMSGKGNPFIVGEILEVGK